MSTYEVQEIAAALAQVRREEPVDYGQLTEEERDLVNAQMVVDRLHRSGYRLTSVDSDGDGM